MKSYIGLGVLGLGNVGSAVIRALASRAEYLERQIGRAFQVRQVLVRDLDKGRDVSLAGMELTTDFDAVLADDETQVIVELMGGVEPANTYLRRALIAGKHVVTANKELMAAYGPELLDLASEHDRDLYFEASVGGGIPLIGPFRQDLAANQISEVHAILNGTTNFILAEMASGHRDYESALADAKMLGYAEPDPSNDLQGHDSASKLAILASLAFKSTVRSDDVFREGISGIQAADFQYAEELGYGIKLLAIAKRRSDGLEVRVHPALIEKDGSLNQVDGVFNAVRLDGDLLGRALFVGRGAGAEPTSSAIVADLIDLAHNLRRGVHNRIPHGVVDDLAICSMDSIRSRYYFRLWVTDTSGVLARIGSVCDDYGISIASVIQKETDESAGRAELVFLTHEACEVNFQEAIESLSQLDVVTDVASTFRIESLVE